MPWTEDDQARYLRNGGAALGWIAAVFVIVIAVGAVLYGISNGDTDMSASRNPANLAAPMAANPPVTPPPANHGASGDQG